MSDFSADEKAAIATESSLAMHQHLSAATITMIDTKSSVLDLSSGTLIEIGGRVLVATAKHCLPHSPEGRLWILPDNPRLSTAGMLGFESVFRHPTLDIGLMELTPSAVREYLPNKKPCSFDDVCRSENELELRLCTLMGSPVQFAKWHEWNGKPAVSAQLMAFSTVPRSRLEWPQIDQQSGDRIQDHAVGIFLDYPEHGVKRLDTGEMLHLASPEGFSGGGLWDQGFTKSELWSPGAARLIGIQSSWSEAQRYVRAIKIVHWINLVRSSIPQLRQLVEEKHPILKAMKCL